jgi:hypothetical protein
VQNVEPFHVMAKIAFDWSPIDSARSYTCEEDLLTDILGRKQSSLKTEPRLMRVDITLHATLPYGSTTPLPDPPTLGSWTNAVGESLDNIFTEIKGRKGRIIAVLGGREEVKVEIRCDAIGSLSMDGLSVSAFRIIQIPRIWDNQSRRENEKGSEDQLADLAAKFFEGMEEWTKAVGELSRWIRYAPPPELLDSDVEFEDEDEEEDDLDALDDPGPETVH